MQSAWLTAHDLDALREVSNIGAGHAATALSQVIQDVVALEIPEVRVLRLREVPEAIGGAEQIVAGIHLRVLGEIRGNLLVVLPLAAAKALLRRMGIDEPDLGAEMPRISSALRELGNILASTYLTAISQLIQVSLVPSVPGLATDMAGAVVDLLLMELAGVTDRAIVLETAFHEPGRSIRGHFFLLPDPSCLESLVTRVRRSP